MLRIDNEGSHSVNGQGGEKIKAVGLGCVLLPGAVRKCNPAISMAAFPLQFVPVWQRLTDTVTNVASLMKQVKLPGRESNLLGCSAEKGKYSTF